MEKKSQEARADIQKLVLMINDYRKATDPTLATLVEDQKIVDAACWMANDMADKNYLSHTDSLGRSTFVRLESFGVYNGKAEIAGAGTPDASIMLEWWQGSPGHNEFGLLNREATRIGVGMDQRDPVGAIRIVQTGRQPIEKRAGVGKNLLPILL